MIFQNIVIVLLIRRSCMAFLISLIVTVNLIAVVLEIDRGGKLGSYAAGLLWPYWLASGLVQVFIM